MQYNVHTVCLYMHGQYFTPMYIIDAMPIESYITQKVMVVSEKTNGTAVCNTVAVVILIVMPVSVGAMLKKNEVSTNPHLCMCSQIFVIVNKKNM